MLILILWTCKWLHNQAYGFKTIAVDIMKSMDRSLRGGQLRTKPNHLLNCPPGFGVTKTPFQACKSSCRASPSNDPFTSFCINNNPVYSLGYRNTFLVRHTPALVYLDQSSRDLPLDEAKRTLLCSKHEVANFHDQHHDVGEERRTVCHEPRG